MSSFLITGGRPLYGSVRVPAAKNAVLPLLAAAVAVRGRVVLRGCPDLTDIRQMLAILRASGAYVTQREATIELCCDGMEQADIAACSEMRSSVFLLGSLLARQRVVRLGRPGGCVIGARPMDIHLDGLRAMGVRVECGEKEVLCDAAHAHPCRYRLAYPSVGATANLLTFATALEGETTIENAAQEPEIADLVRFLLGCGARIVQEGDRLRILGGRPLLGVTYTPVGDRIVAATLLCACAMCGGELRVSGACAEHLGGVVQKIGKSSCIFVEPCGTIHLRSAGKPRAFCCATAPYPGFATDMQALALAYDSVSSGTAIVRERVFENRFGIVAQLQRMGADIQCLGQCVVIRGRRLHAAHLQAPDLRAGAALVLAAMTCAGESVLDGVNLVDRGYQSMEKTLSSIGAKVVRI